MSQDLSGRPSQWSIGRTTPWSWLHEAADDVRAQMWMDHWLPGRDGRLLAIVMVLYAVPVVGLIVALAFST
jgi:hypothetical protein